MSISDFEILSTLNPPADSIVRQFSCAVCAGPLGGDRPLAIVWCEKTESNHPAPEQS
jgi:hypothetical protein